MPPGPHRVQAHDEEAVRAVDRLDGLPLALELGQRMREAGRERVRDVVVPGDHEQRAAEPAQVGGCALVLAPAATVREVARGDDQVGLNPLDQRLETALDPGSASLPTCRSEM